MSCKPVCQLCPKLILSQAITFADGNVVVNLPDGSYTYSAELFGYESKENVPFQVNGANLEIQDTLTAADKIAVTFYVTGAAADTAITITVWSFRCSRQ